MTDEIQNDPKLDWKIKIVDRFMDSLDGFGTKIFSGRFLAITLDTIGYSMGVGICGYLAIKKIIDPGTFIAVLSTYALLVQKTRENYFSMNKETKITETKETKV